MRKFLSVMLSLILLLTMVTPVFADGIIGDIEMDAEILTDEMKVMGVIDQYFDDREEFLKDYTITDFDSANDAIVLDEITHRELLKEQEFIIIESAFSYLDINCIENYAEVSVLETVTFHADGIVGSEFVAHEMTVYMNDGTFPFVISDRYIEAYSGFYSCSYVPTTSDYEAHAIQTGSKLCLIKEAEEELGTVYVSDNNKYTQYTGYVTAWCAAFIAWCANQARISTAVIPRSADVETMADSTNLDLYGRTPRVGDLAVWSNYGHIGIVYSVNSTNRTFTVLHGNWNDTVLISGPFSFTDSTFMGFSRPAYATTSHTYSYTITSQNHSGSCVNCGHSAGTSSHMFKITADGVSVCTVCGYVA